MYLMSVTLDVSKLSGWLNADAPCRESKGRHTMGSEMRAGRREVAGGCGASSVQGRARLQIGSRARGGAHAEHEAHGCDAGGVEAQRLVERPRQLPRVERRAYGAGPRCRVPGGGRWRATAGQAACRGWRDCRLGAGHGEERTSNMPYMVVTLEVSKLSGWLNADASYRESKEGHAMRGEVQTKRPEVAGDRGARSVQQRARLQIGSRARGGAHGEHVSHVCDAGGVEAQRLVERRRGLPRDERRACDAGQGADWEVAGDRGASGVQGGLDCRLGAAWGGAHVEHVAHVCDAGGVEAQRLVERRRRLPRVERRACDAGRGADREAGGGGRPRCTQRAGEGSNADWEQCTGKSARRTCRT